MFGDRNLLQAREQQQWHERMRQGRKRKEKRLFVWAGNESAGVHFDLTMTGE